MTFRSMKRDGRLLGDTTVSAVSLIETTLFPPTVGQSDQSSSPAPQASSTDLASRLAIGSVVLGVLLSGVWILWLGYEGVRLAVWCCRWLIGLMVG